LLLARFGFRYNDGVEPRIDDTPAGTALCPSSAAIISAVRPRLSAASKARVSIDEQGHDLLHIEHARAVGEARRPHQRGELVAVAGINVHVGRQ
jgi:hypothetical protein